jgi:hypothetical protein
MMCTRSVDMRVRRLRRKLEVDLGTGPIIVLERGVGYVFTLPVEKILRALFRDTRPLRQRFFRAIELMHRPVNVIKVAVITSALRCRSRSGLRRMA